MDIFAVVGIDAVAAGNEHRLFLANPIIRFGDDLRVTRGRPWTTDSLSDPVSEDMLFDDSRFEVPTRAVEEGQLVMVLGRTLERHWRGMVDFADDRAREALKSFDRDPTSSFASKASFKFDFESLSAGMFESAWRLIQRLLPAQHVSLTVEEPGYVASALGVIKGVKAPSPDRRYQVAAFCAYFSGDFEAYKRTRTLARAELRESADDFEETLEELITFHTRNTQVVLQQQLARERRRHLEEQESRRMAEHRLAQIIADVRDVMAGHDMLDTSRPSLRLVSGGDEAADRPDE